MTINSSTAKGDAFETYMYTILARELKNRKLGLVPEQSRIFQKRAYPSRDRGTGIIFDISIEVTLPGAANWSILWLWECKHYEKFVPVDDVEEFWAKIQQVAGSNVKAGFASASPLSKGAVRFARAKGFAVIRIAYPARTMSWVLHSQVPPATAEEAEGYLTAEYFEPPLSNGGWVGLCGDTPCLEWPQLIR